MTTRSAAHSAAAADSTSGILRPVGGMIFTLYTGQILDKLGTYTPIFVVAGSAYFVALAIVHMLSPRLERAQID